MNRTELRVFLGRLPGYERLGLRDCFFSHELARAYTVAKLYQEEDYMFAGSVVQFLKTKVKRADAVDEFVAIMNEWRMLRLPLVKTDHEQVQEVHRHYMNWKAESVNMSCQMLWDMVMIDAACWPKLLPRWVFWFYRLCPTTDAMDDLIAIQNTHTKDQFELVLAICIKMIRTKQTLKRFEFANDTQTHYKLFRGNQLDTNFKNYLKMTKSFFSLKERLEPCETVVNRKRNDDYHLYSVRDISRELTDYYNQKLGKWERDAMGFLSNLLFRTLCVFPELTKNMRLKKARTNE